MARTAPKRVLTVNSGSSSIKFSLYDLHEGGEKLAVSGKLERIGLPSGAFLVKGPDGKTILEERMDLPDHGPALKRLFKWLDENGKERPIEAAGHRVVHGGPRYSKTHLIDRKLLITLKDLVPFAPEHLPHEIKAIEEIMKARPGLAQAASFDTAFHREMPDVAQRYPLPDGLWREGIIRYGFHGLSYEYIIGELRKEAGEKAAGGRVIIAHLGNGASMAALKGMKSIDTTMGFTPAAGLMMSRRSGDIDPGIMLYLMKNKGLNADELNTLINEKSGLLGVSGISTDMQDILSMERTDERARFAIEMFAYIARKFIGSLAAALGGLDALVFTAGIGENSPQVRERILQGMEFLGIRLDPERNLSNSGIISRGKGPVTVRVMKTNEELMIARHTFGLLSGC